MEVPLIPTDKNVNDEPPQDRVTMNTDWEWNLSELDDPGEEHPPRWLTRQ